jgi:formylglycine-generating enzyme required for sulfatase activity
MVKPLKLFISYSHKDQEQLDELLKYLKNLVDNGKIEPWTDRLLEIGSSWDSVIKDNLSSADIIILLISVEFINSDYITTTELVATKKRHDDNTAKVIPILLSHCEFSDYWFSAIQGLPEDMVPLSEFKEKNEKSKAYTNVVKKIRELADNLVKDKKLRPYEKLASDLIKDSINGDFSKADKYILNDEQIKLGLTDKEVNEIKNRLLAQHREKSQNCQTYIDCYVDYVKDHGRELSQPYVEQLNRLQERLQITDLERNNLQSQIEKRVKEEEELKVREEEAKRKADAEAEVERLAEEQRAKEEAERRVREEEARRGPTLIQISADRGALVRVGNEWQQKTERITVSGYEQELAEGLAITMLQIPAGSFQMGSPASEAERRGNEGPQHRVQLQSFFLGQTPVTQAQWKEVASWSQVNLKLNPDPAIFKGANRPVEQVSWEEATEFCRRLSKRTKLVYTLPSEAQWEYACRAGTTTPFAFGDTLTPDLANYDGNYTYGSGLKGQYRQKTTDVGSFAGNAWGLQDMHGNVWEWCLDPWHDSYTGAPADGSAWTAGGGTSRLLRGGSWNSLPARCRSACRSINPPDNRNSNVGFRVCCLPQD